MNSGVVAAPGGRRERKRERTRREIFEAALALSGRQGFDAVTIDRICAAADVARGTFFLHFPSKAALLEELGARLGAELADRLPEPRGPALAECRALLGLLDAHARRHAELLGETLRLLSSRASPIPSDDAHTGGDLCARVEEIVGRGQRRGELRRSVAPRLAARMLLAAAAAVLCEPPPRDPQDPDAAREALLQALLHGLREPKPRLKWKPPRRDAER